MFTHLPISKSTHAHFDDIASLCIALASISTAFTTYSAGQSADPRNPNNAIHIGGKFSRYSFQTFGLMHNVSRGGWPTELLLLKSDARLPVEFHPGRDLQQPQLENSVVGHLVGATFVKFYEANQAAWTDHFKTQGKPKPGKWPDLWRFGWHLRNVIVHADGIFDINDQSTLPCTWGQFTLEPGHNGTRWCDLDAGMLGGGDILDLINDLYATPLPSNSAP